LIQEGIAKPKNAALIKEAAEKASVSATSRMAEMIALTIDAVGISRVAELVRAAISDAPPAPRPERIRQLAELVRAAMSDAPPAHREEPASKTGMPRRPRHQLPPPSSAQEPLSARHDDEDSNDRPHSPPR
jgi:hypothetical protein